MPPNERRRNPALEIRGNAGVTSPGLVQSETIKNENFRFPANEIEAGSHVPGFRRRGAFRSPFPPSRRGRTPRVTLK